MKRWIKNFDHKVYFLPCYDDLLLLIKTNPKTCTSHIHGSCSSAGLVELRDKIGGKGVSSRVLIGVGEGTSFECIGQKGRSFRQRSTPFKATLVAKGNVKEISRSTLLGNCGEANRLPNGYTIRG